MLHGWLHITGTHTYHLFIFLELYCHFSNYHCDINDINFTHSKFGFKLVKSKYLFGPETFICDDLFFQVNWFLVLLVNNVWI